MGQHRSEQEWLGIFQQYEQSTVSLRHFCQQHQLNVSTFYAKRKQLCANQNVGSKFVQAEVVEQTMTRCHVTASELEHLVLRINGIELKIPQGTPVPYLAELIGALS